MIFVTGILDSGHGPRLKANNFSEAGSCNNFTVFVCVCVCVYVRTYACIYVYVYVHIYTVYIYIYHCFYSLEAFLPSVVTTHCRFSGS